MGHEETPTDNIGVGRKWCCDRRNTLEVIGESGQDVKRAILPAQPEHAIKIRDRRAIEFSFHEQAHVIEDQDFHPAKGI